MRDRARRLSAHVGHKGVATPTSASPRVDHARENLGSRGKERRLGWWLQGSAEFQSILVGRAETSAHYIGQPSCEIAVLRRHGGDLEEDGLVPSSLEREGRVSDYAGSHDWEDDSSPGREHLVGVASSSSSGT